MVATELVKPSKKRKKVSSAEDAPQNGETTGNASSPTSLLSETTIVKKKKKKKKRKTNAEDGKASVQGSEVQQNGHARSRYSVVGSTELAAAGPKIKKRLHSQTAASSRAEAESWRQQRSISVDDCDLNPVLQFDQAGDHLLLLSVQCGVGQTTSGESSSLTRLLACCRFSS